MFRALRPGEEEIRRGTLYNEVHVHNSTFDRFGRLLERSLRTNPREAPPAALPATVSYALRGRSLFLARAAWVVVALLSLVLFVVSIPGRFEVLRSACTGVACESGALSPENIRMLEELGLSSGFYAGYNVALEGVLAVVFSAVALLVFWRGSESGRALFFSSMLLAFGLFATPAVDTLLAPPYVFWLPTHVLQVFGLWSFLMSFYVFPNWKLEPRWTLPLVVGWTALMLACLIFPSVPFNPSVPSHVPVGWSLMLSAWLLTGVAAQVNRYRRSSDPAERQRTKWFVFGVAVCVAGLVTYATIPLVVPILQEPGEPGVVYELVAKPFVVFVLALIPLSIGVAVLRYRLFDIDLVINRALVYGALTACVVGLYVLVVGGLGVLTDARNHPVFSLLATGLVAVLFAPLRERLQRTVNRLVYGERDEPYEVLSRLGQRLEGALNPDAALDTIVETVAWALKLPYAKITVEREGEIVTSAAYGVSVGGDLTVLPLVDETERVGRLILAPRTPGEPFTASDRRLLHDLARRAGAAVQAVRLTADLRRSRERLVTAREEERRRLRRDLHDGLGPRLAAQTLKVGAARSLFPRDPAAADALLVELEADTDGALADLRHLVYDLRPPALDQFGLAGAIRDVAERYAPANGNGLRVSISTPEVLPALPAAAEVAAYRIVGEALANTARHANASVCAMRLSVGDELLEVEITDDGVGIPADHHSGVGLHSMRERAAELGGTCEIGSITSGGTRVLARLPLKKSSVRGDESDEQPKEHP